MRLLVVMDPPERVNRYSDTTLAIVEEALRRKHDVAVTTPGELWLDDGEAGAAYHHALLPLPGAPETPGLRLGKASAARIAGRFDLVLMRKDPPVDEDYFTTTQILERLRGKTHVVNDPRGLRECNEKLWALRFPHLTPPSRVTRGTGALLDFLRHDGGEMIVKPLDRCGGAGVLHLHAGDRNLHALLELVTDNGKKPVLAQRYLPEARTGDKRILLLDGEVLGVLLRVPRDDETRGNLHAGASPRRGTLDARDHEIIRTVVPALRAEGLSFVGLDVIGGFLTEVNVVSPTGIQEVNRVEERPEAQRIERQVVDWLERRAASPVEAAPVD